MCLHINIYYHAQCEWWLYYLCCYCTDLTTIQKCIKHFIYGTFSYSFSLLLSKTDVKSSLVTNKSNMNFNTIFIPNLTTAKISETCLFLSI